MGISSGRIIDNAGRRLLPIGVESFEAVIGTYVYVDKSLLIRELIDRREYGATLFCRPRRFGKSLAMRMLQCYFEAPVPEAGIPDRSRLFDGLAIAQAGERYTAHMGAHPVIFLTLGEIEGGTWDEVLSSLATIIASEFRRHDYLKDSPALSETDVDQFDQILSQRATHGVLYGSLSFLSRLLEAHHGAKTAILVDEYDKPLILGYLNGFGAEAVSFTSQWLSSAMKGNMSLYLGVLTGVQRFGKTSIFSGLNNVVVNTVMDRWPAEPFGLTRGEVEDLANYLGMADKFGELRDWYDGYRFGDEDAYNPWSVLNYLENGGKAQPYWTSMSDNAVVHDLFRQTDGAMLDELSDLAAGGTVSKSVDLALSLDDIRRDPYSIWSLLYSAGYVTTEDTDTPNDTYMPRELRAPNREVRFLYRREFADRSERMAGGGSRLRNLHDALVAGDAPALEGALRRILLDSPSALDLVRENSYHMLLVGLLYYVYGYRFPLSNREAGDGRADVVLAPERENVGKMPGIVVEVKWGRDLGDAALAGLAADALAQARERDYADALPDGPRLAWGVAFSGKRAAATCA